MENGPNLDVEMVTLLNPEFAQPHFQPDPDKEYHNSKNTKSRGFTYLMALVMSGSSRLEELNYYVTNVLSNLIANKQNTCGWTALMLASRNSRTDSTEKTV